MKGDKAFEILRKQGHFNFESFEGEEKPEFDGVEKTLKLLNEVEEKVECITLKKSLCEYDLFGNFCKEYKTTEDFDEIWKQKVAKDTANGKYFAHQRNLWCYSDDSDKIK